MSEKQRLQWAIALRRFGLGARPGELSAVIGDPAVDLSRQIRDATAFALTAGDLRDTRAAAAQVEAYQEAQRAKRMGEGAGDAPKPRMALAREIDARLQHAIATPNGFAEKLVWFWSNHFTVAAKNPASTYFAGPYEREVIRTGMTGSFANLQLAVMRHPAMLIYLDQAQSIGPNSRIGERRERGLNENLAREALELHSLGAQGGYTQDDVAEFARALTGWTIASKQTRRFAGDAPDGAYIFVEAMHEPGARRVMGKRYPDNGPDQARAILADLALHPKTARRVAERLVRAFVADAAPVSVVSAVEAAYLETNGDLPSLHRALVEHPDAWRLETLKFTSPNEFVVSAWRALGEEPNGMMASAVAYRTLGETPFAAPSPEGWPIDGASWLSPDALIKRLEWAQWMAERVRGRKPPAEILRDALGPLLTPATEQAVRRAESAAQGLAIGLMSPDFQRR